MVWAKNHDKITMVFNIK